MNPILLIVAILFLIPIIKEIRIFTLIRWYSKKVVGKIISIEGEEVYTIKLLVRLLQKGNDKLITVSYQFSLAGKKIEVLNDKVHVSASSYFNTLKKGDNLDVYVYQKNNKVINTWLIKNKLWHLIPYIIMFFALLLVSFLSRNM